MAFYLTIFTLSVYRRFCFTVISLMSVYHLPQLCCLLNCRSITSSLVLTMAIHVDFSNFDQISAVLWTVCHLGPIASSQFHYGFLADEFYQPNSNILHYWYISAGSTGVYIFLQYAVKFALPWFRLTRVMKVEEKNNWPIFQKNFAFLQTDSKLKIYNCQ